MSKFLPYSLPDIGEEEIAEVIQTLRSGWLTTGPKTRQFEKEFAECIGGGVQAIAVNSATAGLHLALESVGIGQGDEVITTPYTFTATAEVIRYLGAHPVFVDIDFSSFNIDTAQIEAAITERTKAIIPVHFGGLACKMDAILALAKKYNLRVIEDAAHALPTTWDKELVGALGSDCTVFSFYATKTMTTGEGGMIVTRNSDIADRCRMMRLHGINRDVFNRYTSSKPDWYYEVVAPGFKYNMTDLAASIGIQQLLKVRRFHLRRQELAARYDRELADLPLVLPQHAPEGDLHAWHLYVVRLTKDIPITRDEFIQKMFDKGIGCSVHFIPLHLHPYWRETYNLQPDSFPEALRAYQDSVSLPLYTKMTNSDQTLVIRTMREILAGRGRLTNTAASPIQ